MFTPRSLSSRSRYASNLLQRLLSSVTFVSPPNWAGGIRKREHRIFKAFFPSPLSPQPLGLWQNGAKTLRQQRLEVKLIHNQRKSGGKYIFCLREGGGWRNLSGIHSHRQSPQKAWVFRCLEACELCYFASVACMRSKLQTDLMQGVDKHRCNFLHGARVEYTLLFKGSNIRVKEHAASLTSGSEPWVFIEFSAF